MVIEILKIGKVITNMGYLPSKRIFLDMINGGYDLTDGIRFQGRTYKDSQLYKVKEELDLEFVEIDLLEHRGYLDDKKDLEVKDIVYGSTGISIMEILTTYDFEMVSENIHLKLRDINLLENLLIAWMYKVDTELTYDTGLYHDTEEYTDIYRSTELVLEHKDSSITLELSYDVDEGSKVVSVTYGNPEDIEKLISNPDRNSIVLNKLDELLRQVSEFRVSPEEEY